MTCFIRRFLLSQSHARPSVVINRFSRACIITTHSRSRWLENCPYVECQVGITSDKRLGSNFTGDSPSMTIGSLSLRFLLLRSPVLHSSPTPESSVSRLLRTTEDEDRGALARSLGRSSRSGERSRDARARFFCTLTGAQSSFRINLIQVMTGMVFTLHCCW